MCSSHCSPAAFGASPAGVPLAAVQRAGTFATEKVSAPALCTACIQHELTAVRHQDNNYLEPRLIDRSKTLEAATAASTCESQAAQQPARLMQLNYLLGRACGCRRVLAVCRAGRRCRSCVRRSLCCHWGRPGTRVRGVWADTCGCCTLGSGRCQPRALRFQQGMAVPCRSGPAGSLVPQLREHRNSRFESASRSTARRVVWWALAAAELSSPDMLQVPNLLMPA